jgi:hypothetical protein
VWLTDGNNFNIWDCMEEWAWTLSPDQHEAYLLACWDLVEPHLGHHRLDVLYTDLRGRRGVGKHQMCGIWPSDEPGVFDEYSNGDRWPMFWLTHFGEHLAADECECDRRLTPRREWPAWWEDDERGERILMATLTCLVVAAGGTPEAAVVFRSMMEDWPGSFTDLVDASTRAAS